MKFQYSSETDGKLRNAAQVLFVGSFLVLWCWSDTHRNRHRVTHTSSPVRAKTWTQDSTFGVPVFNPETIFSAEMSSRRSGANPSAPGGLAQDVTGSRDLQQQVLYLTVGTGWDACRFQTWFTEGASAGPRIPWKGRNHSVDKRQRPRLTPGGQDVNSTYDKYERRCCILILFVGARLFLCCFFSWRCACLCHGILGPTLPPSVNQVLRSCCSS